MRSLTVSALAVATLALAGCSSDATEDTVAPAASATASASSESASESASPSSEPSEEPTDDTDSDDEAAPAAPSVRGMVIHASDYDVPETVSRLQSGLEEAGMVVATLDHAENAASVDMELPPTVLVVGGNAEVGTPILQQDAEAGLELPLRFLAWEADGQVYLGYNGADYLAERADLDDESVLEPVRNATAMLAEAASGNADPLTDGSTGSGDSGESGDDSEVENESEDSPRAVPATQQRLRSVLQGSPLSIVAVVDHAANARSIDAQLAPLRLTLAGNPAAGTQFIAAAQTMGIDLPMRFLVGRSDDGGSEITVPDFADLVERHGITGLDDAVDMVEQAQQGLLDMATRGGGNSGNGGGNNGRGNDNDNDNEED